MRSISSKNWLKFKLELNSNFFLNDDKSFLNDVISVQRGRKMKKDELPNSIDRNNRYVVIEGFQNLPIVFCLSLLSSFF